MQFRNTIIAAAALASSVNAKVELNPTTYATIAVGKPFNITYSGAAGPVSLFLENGPQTNLKDFETITTGLPEGSGSFLWTPSSSLPADQYAIKITDGTTSNYGAVFQPIGATASASSSAASSTSGSSTSTSSGSSSATTTSASSSSGSSSSTTSAATTGGNSTTTASSKTSSKTSATSTGADSTQTTSAPGGNSAAGLASPLAMVLLGLAAVLSFN